MAFILLGNQNEAAASSTDESKVPSISRNNNNDSNNIDQCHVEREEDIPQNKNAEEPMVEGNLNTGRNVSIANLTNVSFIIRMTTSVYRLILADFRN